MPIDRSHYTTILRFWRSIETFTLPDLPAIKKSDHVTLLTPGMPLPWEPGQLPPPGKDKQWRHTLYFHIVPKDIVIGLLARLTHSREYHDPTPGNTCLSALTLDSSGKPSNRSYAAASFIYAIKAIRDHHDPDIITPKKPDDLETANPPAITWTFLTKETEHLQKLARRYLQTSIPIRCVSGQIAASSATTLDAPFLNSYYLQDLDALIRHPQDIGRPLQALLSPAPPADRIDLLDPKILSRCIQTPPPPGRWPSNPDQGLFTAQYAALNITLSHPNASPPLLGINGPPGTGKTTLLREIIANIIVNRARRLLTSNPADLFHPKRQKLSEHAGFYRPDPDIIGSDGIVVSGNNNAAIENISRQLPLTANIDHASFPDAAYFSNFATNILGQPCWAMISADLGRSQKRSDFIGKFWFNKSEGFGAWLRKQYEDHHLASDNAKKLATTATRLRSLLKKYDSSIKTIQPPTLDGLSRDDIHRVTPYANPPLHHLRSNIFLDSLRLHEYTIRHNARHFYQNLGTFVDMLKGKWRDDIDADIATQLWNTFFFCIPVVSVTLASFQRQFQQLGRGSIGWLLLDEAGQASSPSVCGALWRCRRCILIGDTRQIPPVVTIPETLVRLLQQQHGVKNDDWAPTTHSAQSLADRITAIGAYIPQPPTAPVWTGIPLRAHRRCHEPMFSIANTIAYNNQMIQATPHAGNPHATTAGAQDHTPLIPTGPSGWIHPAGSTPLDGHAIIEELEIITDLLQSLSTYPHPIFIISPFRSIADACRERYETPLIKCGTIHTFQGKEADIVILVLGTQPTSVAARNWVAATPNILNVAITRARHRIYVIGNRHTWSKHNYFNTLALHLPPKPHGRLQF